MGDYRLIGKRHNNPTEKIVTDVKIGTKVFPIGTIIDWIERKIHTFYTMYENNKAHVSVKIHPKTGRKYLWSSPDGVQGNNIDNLPDC